MFRDEHFWVIPLRDLKKNLRNNANENGGLGS
jgi:hypothetical protein